MAFITKKGTTLATRTSALTVFLGTAAVFTG